MVAERGGVVETVRDRELVAVCLGDAESVAVSVTVNDWAVVNVWVTVVPEPVVPSPWFQASVQGDVSPVLTAENVTSVMSRGVAGRNVMLVDSGGGREPVTVW